MINSYWTSEKKKALVELVRKGCSLKELHEQFPVKSTMSIIFAVRAVSSLALSTTQNKAAMERVKDQNLTKREAFPDSNRLWEDWDSRRLQTFFLQPMSIEDIYLNLGRTYTAIFKQMEKMYPNPQDRQMLFAKIAFYVRFKPLKKVRKETDTLCPTETSSNDDQVINNSFQKNLICNKAKAVAPQPIKTTTKKTKIVSSSDVVFENIENRIVSELEKARWNIKIAVAWITNKTLVGVIMSKLDQGLDVALILNKDKINCGLGAIDFQSMCKSGLSLHWVTNLKESLMHEKFCIIDNECLIEGTYNWTNRAEEKNDEHIVIIKANEEMINAFTNRFDFLQEKYPALEVEVSSEWLEKNKTLMSAYTEYLLKLHAQKDQIAISPSKKSRKRNPLEPTNIWKEYYSRPWTIDDEAILLHYYYKEGLKIRLLSSILKRTDGELKKRLEELKDVAAMLGLRKNKSN